MYFKTFQINDHIYQFKDPLGVLCTLIIGKEKAMLIDTCYGIGDLPSLIKKLYQLTTSCYCKSWSYGSYWRKLSI